MKPQEIITKMLPLISSMDKVNLIKDLVGLGSDVDVTPSTQPNVYTFTFYGDQVSYKCETIINNVDGFAKHIKARISKAKNIHTSEQTVVSALEDEKEFSMEEFVDEMMPKVTTEEGVSDIFNGNWKEFEMYYQSSKRSALEQDIRGLLSEIHRDPFRPLWDVDNPTE